MDNDTYKTIESLSQGVFREKGSKFIAIAYPISEQSEIQAIVDKLKKEHHEARHHCYAWMLGVERTNWRVNDDGEPSGTAGKPILGQINSAGLTNILIVVIRYFGGTLLGVSGLINAYRTSASEAIKNASIVEKTLHEYYKITFPYIAMNQVMKILKEENAGQSDQRFDTECSMIIHFRISMKDKVLTRFSRVDGVLIEYIKTS